MNSSSAPTNPFTNISAPPPNPLPRFASPPEPSQRAFMRR
jgi:hypothetical protein